MAEDILSQEEVDALLRGIGGAREDPGAPERAGGARHHGVGRQERIVRKRLQALEVINERFARLLRVGLYNLTRRNPQIAVGPVRVMKYDEFVRNLAVPTNVNVVRAQPLRGTGLMVLDANLVFQAVDLLFGGQGRFHTRVEGRDFTPTEMRVARRLLDIVFDAYQQAWQPMLPLTFEYLRSESNARLANIVAPTEMVVSVSHNIDLGNGGGDFHLCLPCAMLEPIRGVVYGNAQAEGDEGDTRWASSLCAQVYRAEVELVANLARATLSVGQLMALQSGDVVALDLPELATAEVDGVPVLECHYGVVNGRYALKVERVLSGGQDGGQ